MLSEDGKFWIQPVKPYNYEAEHKRNQEIAAKLVFPIEIEPKDEKPVTVKLTLAAYGHNIKVYDIVRWLGPPGIIYRIKKFVDDDGAHTTYSIKGWKIYKYAWQNKLNLFWLKVKVKLHLI